MTLRHLYRCRHEHIFGAFGNSWSISSQPSVLLKQRYQAAHQEEQGRKDSAREWAWGKVVFYESGAFYDTGRVLITDTRSAETLGIQIQWGSEIRPFEIQKLKKSWLFEGRISKGRFSNGWVLAMAIAIIPTIFNPDVFIQISNDFCYLNQLPCVLNVHLNLVIW